MSARRAIDFNHLDSYTAGDQELIREVLRLFRGQVEGLVQSLETAPDSKAWRDTAHGIKGAARGIGAWEAADAAEQVEKAPFSDATARNECLRRLNDAFAAVAAEIEAELNAPENRA